MARETKVVHGYRRSYLIAGSGPALLLVHGIGDSSRTWEQVVPLLARDHLVIAPDLLGHGMSDKPRADYSVGGFANGMRDLLTLLDVERATVVGHSLGGGIAMQFAYQYPERCERLVLVASGGFGTEVTPLLRLAALPGASTAIGASLQLPARLYFLAAVRASVIAGMLARDDADELTRVWLGLRDRSTRAAFLRTLRGVIDVRGQAISMRDRSYLTAGVPTLLVWGGRDLVLPVAHVHAVAQALPDARVDVVPRAGHVPHRTDMQHFVSVVSEFVRTTPGAVHDAAAWRALLEHGAAGDQDPVDRSRSASLQDAMPPPSLNGSDSPTGTER